MSTFEKDLQKVKPWDEVQCTQYPFHYQGYPKIITAGHGYLVVRLDDMHAHIAKEISGFVGEKAYYLEEDCEASEFFEKIS